MFKAAAAFFRRPVVIILIVGLVIRAVLMPFFAVVFDVSGWALAMQHIQAGVGLYEMEGYWYTPVWGYILGMTSYLMNLLGVTGYGHLFDEILRVENIDWFYSATVTSPAFNLIVKIPSVIADVLVGYLIFKMIKEKTNDERKATYGFALWFLCPFVIYTSSVHGMFDSIYVLFMVLSVYALRKGHDFLAGASLAVAVLLKVFPAFVILPLIAYLAMKHKGDGRTLRKRLGITALGIGVMTLLIYIPQILDGTVAESLLFFTSRANGASLTGSGEGLWDSLTSFGMGLVIWLQPIFFVIIGIFVYVIYKKGGKDTDKALFAGLMLATSVIFLWPASPQFMLTALPFLIVFIAVYDKRFIIPLIVITIALTCNVISNFSALLPLAMYTNLLDPGTVVSMMEWMWQPLVFGLSKHHVLLFFVSAAQIIGTAMVVLYGIRHEKEVNAHA
jgi:hypothetical protein